MGARFQFDDCIEFGVFQSLTADSTANNSVVTTGYNTENGSAITCAVDVKTLAANTSLGFKLQHADKKADGTAPEASSYEDVEDPGSREETISANGVVKTYYAGNKDYVRAVFTSNQANPGAALIVSFSKTSLAQKPNNVSF